MKIHGSCHCGRIRFEGEADPAKVGICHCSDCQSLTGSAFSVFAPIPKEHFRLTAGTPKIYVKTAQSGNRRAQAFCEHCGTRLYAAAEKDTLVYNVRLGTVQERAELPPKVQLWCRSALPWVADLQGVPKNPQQP
jgi:hypothetical protein